jgi:ATP-dependent protease ClpP protease subunit
LRGLSRIGPTHPAARAASPFNATGGSPMPDNQARSSAVSPPAALLTPTVSLHGPVDDDMLSAWIDALRTAWAGDGPLVLELSTTGGDAEIGRRIADDARLYRERTGRPALFLGKTMIYSAGATIMGGFLRTDRWLSVDAVVMVHGRKLSKCLTYEKALRAERVGVQALLEEIDAGIALERVEFAKFIDGSDVTLEEIDSRTLGDWYITAAEALKRGLIAGLL